MKMMAFEMCYCLPCLCPFPVTKVLLIYALNVTERANPHFKSCLCKMIRHENKSIIVNHFHPRILLLALLIQTQERPNI